MILGGVKCPPIPESLVSRFYFFRLMVAVDFTYALLLCFPNMCGLFIHLPSSNLPNLNEVLVHKICLWDRYAGHRCSSECMPGACHRPSRLVKLVSWSGGWWVRMFCFCSCIAKPKKISLSTLLRPPTRSDVCFSPCRSCAYPPPGLHLPFVKKDGGHLFLCQERWKPTKLHLFLCQERGQPFLSKKRTETRRQRSFGQGLCQMAWKNWAKTCHKFFFPRWTHHIRCNLEINKNKQVQIKKISIKKSFFSTPPFWHNIE